MPTKNIYIPEALAERIENFADQIPLAAILKKGLEEFLGEVCDDCGQVMPVTPIPAACGGCGQTLPPPKRASTKKVVAKKAVATKKTTVPARRRVSVRR